ncbi:uncharacterized protein LOC100678394 isoform X2 [Nasonia vitripennis]|uniref:Uncharacterized protein n=1 Tax=Nasonia vitripennis TaxID=7425 RepID=A0A7M7QDV9_NASVI|nr:uncharacterized protein LOC100678394 isoform X2 [Nasonia vitripennis]
MKKMDSVTNENRKSANELINPKDRLLKNIKLSDLASKFEYALDRVEELELHHLIEPIKSTAEKLRQLEEVKEKLACDYYDDYPCANKNCCNAINVSPTANKEPLKANQTGIISSKNEPIGSYPSDDSCKCYNADGVRSCHCGSEETVKESCGKKLISTLGSKNIEKTRGGKCNPCKCSLDESGKKMKTLDCKLAARARKRRRYEELRLKSNEASRPLTADAKIPTVPDIDDNEDVIVERRISNSRFNIQTNLNNMSLSINKENTVINHKAYMKVKEKNQATFCNLSSESSTEEYESDCSSEEFCCGKNFVNEAYSSSFNEPTLRCLAQKDGFWRSDADLGSCGCGRQVDKGENKSPYCPCGCGDVMDLPVDECVQRSLCQCENCGKEIATSWPSAGNTEKPVSLDGSIARQQVERALEIEKLPRDGCVIPYADIRMYIEDLEAQCREKDNIITELTQARGSTRPPTYIT